MNDLIRPALYQSYHEIVPVERRAAAERTIEKIDIVGPVCESGDFFAQDREMPEVREGDLLAIMSAGAYGFVMASNYNSRPLPAEALVRGDKFALIRKRQTWEDLVREEVDEIGRNPLAGGRPRNFGALSPWRAGCDRALTCAISWSA